MKRAALFAVLATFSTLTGCAMSPWGDATTGAVYRYAKTAEGCEVTVSSGREVGEGSITILDDCSFEAKADAIGSDAPWKVIETLIGRLP